ncbi:hypothetical protein Syun_028791 [Stephania yunnanensis]|uniref:Uncharacterized protein n=1 Tax=Stephania yunnanensis TaxID=152371 RepID=A0AAP0HIV1_9MAGN
MSSLMWFPIIGCTLLRSVARPHHQHPGNSHLANRKMERRCVEMLDDSFIQLDQPDVVRANRQELPMRSLLAEMSSLMRRLVLALDPRVPVAEHKEIWRVNDKRRRRWRSRSTLFRNSFVSLGSDRSGTRRCCSVGAGTCSDFPVAAAGGTDSSGELFVSNGDPNWSSDVSEARNSRNSRRERRESVGEKESLGSGNWVGSNGVECQGNESGYGSEPGYRGDVEFGYGDEFDEEEDDGRVLFWGEKIGDTDCKMEIVGESQFSEQKTHHRGRRKKHDCR